MLSPPQQQQRLSSQRNSSDSCNHSRSKKFGAENQTGTGTKLDSLRRGCGSFCLDATSSWAAICPRAPGGVWRGAGSARGPCPGGSSEPAAPAKSRRLPPPPLPRLGRRQSSQLCTARGSRARRGSPARPRLLIGQLQSPGRRSGAPPSRVTFPPRLILGSIQYQGSACSTGSAPTRAAANLPEAQGEQWLSRMCGEDPDRGHRTK